MSEVEEILSRKATELTRKIQSPTKEEQHLVLHWTNGQGFAQDFNLTLSLRGAKVESIVGVANECRKELLRRGITGGAR